MMPKHDQATPKAYWFAARSRWSGSGSAHMTYLREEGESKGRELIR